MRYAILLICLLSAAAGCDPRSPELPPTDKWVRFHCPGKFSDKPVCMVELPGKPELVPQSLYHRLRSGNNEIDYYRYACGKDGEYGICVGLVAEQDREPPLSDAELQDIGTQMAEQLDATLTVNKPFVLDNKYPALELVGEKRRGLHGKFRARIIYKGENMIVQFAVGRSSVVREQEVAYFFDSLLLYK